MAEPSTHINYSFEDIQRYLQGKMSAAEMHAVEKAALQDPFLADAIEGYREVPQVTAQQHLKEINAALQTEQKNSKIISLSKQTQWLRIAAVIIILSGVGVIGSYILKNSNKQQQIAQVKKEEKNNNTTIATQDSATAITPETSSFNKNSVPVIAKNKTQRKIHSIKKTKANELYVDADTNNETNSAASLAIRPKQSTEADKTFSPAPLANKKIMTASIYIYKAE